MRNKNNKQQKTTTKSFLQFFFLAFSISSFFAPFSHILRVRKRRFFQISFSSLDSFPFFSLSSSDFQSFFSVLLLESAFGFYSMTLTVRCQTMLISQFFIGVYNTKRIPLAIQFCNVLKFCQYERCTSDLFDANAEKKMDRKK